MAHSSSQQNPDTVRSMFAGIAEKYDLANHVLSGGIDFLWRARAARMVKETNPRAVLDLATGSGDLAVALMRACPDARVVGADFCAPMLEIASKKGVKTVEADALALPFGDQEFDAVTVAFGLRNMFSRERALVEMARVLAPGGLLLVMDFAMPRMAGWRALYGIYLHRVLPRMAGWLTGHPESYEYLGASIEAFPRWENMLALIENSGFTDAQFLSLAGGIAAIYSAQRKS
jgi:demethylmenaquinone methyltransferase / 2-methoxy-6-polyprenyl-1,4-benzoquinol methylase